MVTNINVQIKSYVYAEPLRNLVYVKMIAFGIFLNIAEYNNIYIIHRENLKYDFDF